MDRHNIGDDRGRERRNAPRTTVQTVVDVIARLVIWLGLTLAMFLAWFIAMFTGYYLGKPGGPSLATHITVVVAALVLFALSLVPLFAPGAPKGLIWFGVVWVALGALAMLGGIL
jgi:hypothetical protein